MKRFVQILSIIFLSNIFIIAQDFSYNDTEFISATVSEEATPQAQVGGLYKPSQNAQGQFLRALVVFVQFTNDTRSDINWPAGQLPTWAFNFIDSSPSSSYRNLTFSDYWKEMSFPNNLDFIGDVYNSLVTLPSESNYSGLSYGDANEDIIDTLAADPSVDFGLYDNWRFNSTTHSFEFAKDNIVDMLIIIYRNPQGSWFENFTAIATLSDNSFSHIDNGVEIRSIGRSVGINGSGITVKQGLKGHIDLVPIIAHEYGHYLFGPNHNNLGGIMVGIPYDSHSSTFALSGWERERLNYIDYITVTQDNTSVTLHDFVSTGDVLRIPVPITNPSSSTYFLVENHQKLSSYDQIMRGGSVQGGYDYSSLGSGIYIWLIRNGNSYPTTNNDLKTADGSWDWQFVSTISMPAGWPSTMPLTDRQMINRNTGKSDRHPRNISWNGNWWGKWHDRKDQYSAWELTRNVMGDEKDAYNVGYNNLFTPWSSPSTYVDGTTNIGLELVSKQGNDITVRVHTTYNSNLTLPPSKPQNLKFTYSNPDHPSLAWDLNVEDDISIYRIYRNYDNSGWVSAGIVSHPTNTFVDNVVDYTKPIWAKPVKYYVIAIDNTSLSSLPSDQIETIGIMNLPKINTDDFANAKAVDNFELLRNYPNPFNPSTKISYSLPEASFVTLKVYDVLGREIVTLVNEAKPSGKYEVEFKASELPSGTYLYKLTAGNNISTKKMLLIK